MKVFLTAFLLFSCSLAFAKEGVNSCVKVLQQKGPVSTESIHVSESALEVELEHPMWGDFQYKFDSAVSMLYRRNKQVIDDLIKKEDPYFKFLMLYGAEFEGHTYNGDYASENLAPDFKVIVETLNRKRSEGFNMPIPVFPIRLYDKSGDILFKFVEFGKSITTDGIAIPGRATLDNIEDQLLSTSHYFKLVSQGYFPVSGPGSSKQFGKNKELDSVGLIHDIAHIFLALEHEAMFKYLSKGAASHIKEYKAYTDGSGLHKKIALDQLKNRIGKFNEWHSVFKSSALIEAENIISELGVEKVKLSYGGKTKRFVTRESLEEKIEKLKDSEKHNLKLKLIKLYEENMIHYGGAVADGIIREANIKRYYSKGKITNIYSIYRSLKEPNYGSSKHDGSGSNIKNWILGFKEKFKESEEVNKLTSEETIDLDYILASAISALDAFSQFTVDEILEQAYTISPEKNSDLNFVHSQLGIFSDNTGLSYLFND